MLENASFKNVSLKENFVSFLKKNQTLILLVILFILINKLGLASTSGGMPWEGPLDKLVKSFTGPVAKAVGILAICLCGGAMAIGEMGSAMKKMLNIVMGLSIVFAAATWGLPLLGFSGSVLM